MTARAPTRAQRTCGFHDAECSHYRADLPLWASLAETAGPGARILDLGAGTGRVTLSLAAEGHDVAGVDVDGDLVDELRRRAAHAGIPVHGAVADLRQLDDDLPPELLGAQLLLVPMQTVQLLGGPTERARFFAAAAAVAAPGAMLVLSVVEEVEPFDGRGAPWAMLAPDLARIGPFRFESTPLAVLQEHPGAAVEMLRVRTVRDAAGEPIGTPEEVVITLDAVTADALSAEAAHGGWSPAEVIRLPPTDEHAGSIVVTLQREGAA